MYFVLQSTVKCSWYRLYPNIYEINLKAANGQTEERIDYACTKNFTKKEVQQKIWKRHYLIIHSYLAVHKNARKIFIL